MELNKQKCKPCEGGTIPLNQGAAEKLLSQIVGWSLTNDAKKISKQFQFNDFKEALTFVNKVGDVAESEGHHPNIHITDYKYVTIDLTTHAIKGLSTNDFILAAKIDEIIGH